MKLHEALAGRRCRTPSLGEDGHGENLTCQLAEIRPELVRRQRNSAPAAWSFGPHMQAVTGAAGQDLPLIEADSTPDRRRLIADGEQRQQHVRWDLEETNPRRAFVDGPETQALQFDMRQACAKFPASGHDETDIADVPQGLFEVTCIAESRRHAGRHRPPARFDFCSGARLRPKLHRDRTMANDVLRLSIFGSTGSSASLLSCESRSAENR